VRVALYGSIGGVCRGGRILADGLVTQSLVGGEKCRVFYSKTRIGGKARSRSKGPCSPRGATRTLKRI